MDGRNRGTGTHCMETSMNPRSNSITDNTEKKRHTINLILEMAALLLGWIILEGEETPLRHRPVAIYSDNTPTVEWTERWLQKDIRQKEDSSGN